MSATKKLTDVKAKRKREAPDDVPQYCARLPIIVDNRTFVLLLGRVVLELAWFIQRHEAAWHSRSGYLAGTAVSPVV